MTEISQEARDLAIARKHLEIIRNVSSELNKLSGLKDKLDNILQILDQQFGIAHSMILMPDQDQLFLSVYASRGYPETNSKIPFGEGIAGMVAAKKIHLNLTGLKRKRNYMNNFLGNEASEENKLPGLHEVESQIAIPLLSNNELVAVLLAESYAPSVFNFADEKFLLTLTTPIAVSIQNSILFDSMEEKIKVRTSELEELNQTKDKLFSIISHDLRSPVTSFQSITQLLKHYVNKGETQKIEGLGDKIDQSVNRLNFLLDNLLNWSLSQGKNITHHPETIELDGFLNDIVNLYCDIFTSKNISLNISIEKELKLTADPNTLSVIFRNLLSNALKFTPRDGKIIISASKNEQAVTISISDSGIGMSDEKLKSLFVLGEKKSTIGTEKERGTGLGLVLVNEFVVLNGGSISVESKESKGTKVVITFPV